MSNYDIIRMFENQSFEESQMYADRSLYQSANRPVWTGVVVIFLIAAASVLLDGFVRGAASEPQLYQTHVRYTWHDKHMRKKCAVVVKGEAVKSCKEFTPEEIATMRLQNEKLPPQLLAKL